MSFLPSVVSAKHVDGYRVHLAFDDGVQAILDFERWLNGPIFESVKAIPYFSHLFVEGGGVAWPNGADIAPEALYEAALAARSEERLQRTAAVREKRTPYKTSGRRRRN